VGGEALSMGAVRFLQNLNPEMAIYNEYGPTEATVGCVVKRLEATEERVLIGRPIANSRVYILNEKLMPTPIGVPGELYISGAGISRGYLNSDALTAERFVPDPFLVGERMYRSGDLARWLPDGNIECFGRVDEQVKLRGIRIEPGEIETVLCERAGVQESVVSCREDTPGDQRLVAYVVTSEDAVDADALREWTRDRLPSYMVPSAWVFMNAIPLTSNGKFDRKALPAPEGERQVRGEYVAPRGEVEEQLAQIWREVLGSDRVGADDDFFALGGHSLLVMQVVNRVRQALGVELALMSLFECPTVAMLAERIENARWAERGRQEVFEATNLSRLAGSL